MTGRNTAYRNRFDEDFRPLMGELRITVYGSYRPPEEKRRLVAQRDFLRGRGYRNTFLVEDMYEAPDNEGGALDQSKRCLEDSDTNFLIFTMDGKIAGVTRELAHVATSPSMADKILHCVMFDQVRDGISAASPLSLGDVKNSGMSRRAFTDYSELCRALSREADMQTRILRHVLMKRIH